MGRSVSVMRSLEHPPALAPPRQSRAVWRQWLTAALDLVFPPFCPVCAERLGPARRDPLCGACWEGLERVSTPGCAVCGLSFVGFAGSSESRSGAEGDRGTCGACRRHPPAFAYARAAAHYGDRARAALHAFKFGGRRALAAPLGDLLAELGPALPLPAVDLIVPVPLHPRRERERGFNQSWLLARRVAAAWRVTARVDALTRRVATAPQTALGADARRVNVAGAFRVRRPELVAGRHVLLVDDIMTNGATAGACARALREAGAATVGVVTVARAG